LPQVVSQLANAAEAYLAAGLCALPARRAEKRPAVGRWKQFQTRMPTAAELRAWRANRYDAVCLLCGRASGHLECIDFDAGGELFSKWWDRIPPELRDRLVVQKTPSGGYHVLYRCESPICGNLKLAQRRIDVTAIGDEEPRYKIITLIETRGEGGLFLCTPTAGYELIQGDLCAPPVFSDAERDVLLRAAWELNEHMPPVVNGPSHNGDVRQRSASSVGQGERSADNSHNGDCPSDNGHSPQTTAEPGREFGQVGLSASHPPGSADNSHTAAPAPENAHTYAGPQENATASPCGRHVANGERPGDDYNARGDVRAILQEHGWVCVPGRKGTDGNEYWRRPGKDSGWSATLKDSVFYVFSSNASPFEPNQAYAPFAVYALLTCGGDYEQAARSLRERGFGGDPPADSASDLDISAIAKVGGPKPADTANENPPLAYEWVRRDELVCRPPDWLLRGILERDTFALIFGDPGSGKTFLALDWACRIATGTPWRGKQVAQAPVFYVAGEGRHGFARRIHAWEQYHEIPLGTAPFYVGQAIALSDPDRLAELVAATDAKIRELGEPPALIVLDTLARNFGGGDENATKDMSRFVTACDQIRQQYGCAVLVVHHAGHGDKTRGRGASALKAALDAEYRVEKAEDGKLLVTATKMKDAELPAPLAMQLESVDLPGMTDDQGIPVTSAALNVLDAETSALVAQVVAIKPSGTRGRWQELGLSIARQLASQNSGQVSVQDWHTECEAAGMARATRYRTLRALQDARNVAVTEDGMSLDVLV